MKRMSVWVVAALAAGALGVLAAATLAADAKAPVSAKVPDGKPVFETYKCGSCHSIEKQGIKKKAAESEAEGASSKAPDLSGVGAVRTTEWMAGFLQKKEKLGTKLHIKKFRGTDQELATLTGWLVSLKDEESAKKLKDAEKEAAAKAADAAPEKTEPAGGK